MGLILYLRGSVNPTEPSVAQQVQQCEDVTNQSYVCRSGHCCVEAQCCSYFYEYWWFWLVWAIIFILICSCVFHHRRIKHRLQQQRRQHEINLIAYREAHNFTSPPFYSRFLPSSLLPDYDEVMIQPLSPPPPYNQLNAGPPFCSDTDQPDVQCTTRPATPMTTPSVTPCLGPDTERSEDSSEHQHKAKETVSGQEVSGRSLRDAEVTEEDKERAKRRRRHFTGDSGIEVCLCEQRTESHESKEHQKLQNVDGQEYAAELCAGCGLAANEPDEREMEPGASQTPEASPHNLYLQTINEQEGPLEPQN